MGRPTKLTPEIQKRIIDAILAGNYFETACRFAGISHSTAHEWLTRGEDKSSRGRKPAQIFAAFAEAVRKAEAEAEVRTVANWQKAVPEEWQAARDFLARRHPDRWGPKERREHSGPGGGAIPISIEERRQLFVDLGRSLDATPEAKAALVEVLRKRLEKQTVNGVRPTVVD